MFDFLILNNKPPNYTKKDIDLGNISPEIYSLCSIIRACFCLSYSIRKDTNLFLYFESLGLIVKFEGQKLRFLGSDERSQAILLEKAFSSRFKSNSIKWMQSTPGIYIKTHTSDSLLYDFLFKELSDTILFLTNNDAPEISLEWEQLGILKNFTFIISSNNYSYDLEKIGNRCKDLNKQIFFFKLPKIKTIESKVLYINFKIDRQQNQ